MQDASAQPKPWRIWIDTGGTFTDCLALDPAGQLHRAKVLSSGALRGRLRRQIDTRRLEIDQRWGVSDEFVRGFRFRWLDLEHEPVPVAAYDAASSVIELQGPVPPCAAGHCFELRSGVEAPILAAQIVTGAGQVAALPGIEMRLATTRGTNALLERRGADVALLVTKGFGDLLLIGDQQRPDLFALHIDRPRPLYRSVIEVEERLAADGSEVDALQAGPALDTAKRALGEGVRVAAVALAHAYRNPQHERRLARLLREAGFEHVSCSADLSPLIKLLPRAETAVVNAYLAPMIEAYLAGIRETLSGGRLHIMTSAGGLVPAEACRAKDGLLSGPAGGVAGAAAAAARSGFERVIGFDMGGTSTDVARYDGDYEYQFEHRVGGAGGVRLVAPALAIETVAAGGGSICTYADGSLRVGPESASAVPGPACYGAGGPLTLTDVNLLLGRLDPERFEIPISRQPAEAMLGRVCDTVAQQTGKRPDREGLLEGFLEIANERMGDAIAEVSLRRGYDPCDYALVAFGGAGGQHACAVAEHLGIETIVMPADASLLSALGLGRAVVERFAERQVLGLLDEVRAAIADWMEALGRQAAAEVAAEGVPENEVIVRRRMVNLRLLGQESSIAVGWSGDIDAAFADRYRAMYGHAPQGPIEVESIRAVASSPPAAVDPPASTNGLQAPGQVAPSRQIRSCFGGRWRQVPAWERADLRPGVALGGPALVFDSYSAYVIEAAWEAAVDGAGALVLRRVESGTPHDGAEVGRRPEVVRQELFTNRFASIARQMGRMLQRTALSTNVKERLDFSCALLDAQGELVVNAPHIPVHLGAIGLCVRSLRDAVLMEPGDVVVTNHPAFGGSHLPDVTVVTPVHGDQGLLGYTASRAHHAEIGGLRPGSMPPLATTLAEEGVVIPPQHLVRAGVSRFDCLERLLREAPHPSRAVGDNLADLRAAVAANQRGAAALADLAREHGAAVISEQMAALKTRARSLAQAALARLPDKRYEGLQRLDDGSAIRVAIDLKGDHAVIDFAGSADRHPGNLNATPAVVRSAVIYVLRLLIGRDLPLNEGIMQAVDVNIPPGMLDPSFEGEPARLPAVGGGNVETSQRIVDALLEALGVCACSQGTMNNILFGTEGFSYYETVCGGAGAGPDYDGADAVHTHMTNTRITDPEIVEQRYPVRLERFAVRRGSGGRGRHRGGDGVVREVTFLEPMALSILSQHRAEGPYGMQGGEPGAPGGQRIERVSGGINELGAIDGTEVGPGDRLILETPGGGGWGRQEI
ncbi:MAG: hydantoinase B/oxoprolinase family protein [Planctomycetota bacterium]|jgi:5-oxoprolinase (ATP-hydrolysing)